MNYDSFAPINQFGPIGQFGVLDHLDRETVLDGKKIVAADDILPQEPSLFHVRPTAQG